MWLPAPIYKRAPYYWTLIGVLLAIFGTFYVQQGEALLGWLCLGCGVASCFWSVHVALNRQSLRPTSSADPDLDQTCELNYRPEQDVG